MICLRYAPNSTEAKDIFQNGLIEIFSDLHQFAPEKGSFSNWSKRVMAHTAIRHLKRRTRTFEVQGFDPEESYIAPTDNTESVDSEMITLAIQQLPVGYRTVFNMYVIEDYSHQEIAEYLGISVSTSKSQLHKAKKQLRMWLEVKL